jgi:hypothetical protein|tara:strand:+ start:66 stop:284 length:219 start_codon:yes stop_codon:yes gene_type:complete
MICIKGTLNIIWIADVWNDEECAPYLVSNEAKRKQHAVIAGIDFRDFSGKWPHLHDFFAGPPRPFSENKRRV